MKRTLNALLIATALMLSAVLTACATAQADAPEKPAVEFKYVHDWSEPKEPQGMVRIKKEMDEKAASDVEAAQEAAVDPVADSQSDYWDNGAYSGPYDPDLNNNPEYLDGGYDHWFMIAGVASDDNYSYSYYPQRVLPGDGLYELNANGRHVDEDGFIRDGDGYIAIAMDGVDKLAVVDTMFGPAKVYDRMNGDDAPYTGEIDVYTDF